MDEIAEYREPEIFNQVVRPALSDKKGKCLFIGTPKGFNHFYDMYQMAKDKEDWAAFSFMTIDSPFFQTEQGIKELEEAKALLSDLDYQQEYEAKFINFSGRIYHAFSRETCGTNICYTPDNGHLLVGMDFNHSPHTACIFQLVSGKLIQVDEVFIKFGDTEAMCRELKKRYPNQEITV
jgi:hypothetical protein